MLLRNPLVTDGYSVNQLVAASPPLDTNSAYCNLLQCTHFGATSVLAEDDEGLKGFISGYWIPARNQELFVWQVAVAASARGEGLAKSMLEWLVNETKPTALETTITADNKASWALFQAFADARSAVLTDVGICFDKTAHFSNQHETERLVRIAPQLGESTL